jgi:hypothetical protein
MRELREAVLDISVYLSQSGQHSFTLLLEVLIPSVPDLSRLPVAPLASVRFCYRFRRRMK